MAKVMTRQEIEAEIIKKAWEDDNFRQELLANPKATLTKMFNIDFPEELKFEIHEESPLKMHLVLPVKTGMGGNAELSDDDLEAVSGGTGGTAKCGRPGGGGGYNPPPTPPRPMTANPPKCR